MVRKLIRYLERWSLDAVLVAAIWGLALERMAGRGTDFWALAVLALATWLTYVADRLWEVRPGCPVPRTDRHLYHKRHYKKILLFWSAVFVFSVILSVLVIPLWKWAGGWGIVAGVAGYFALLGRRRNAFMRMFLKRLVVPLIFTAGVAWMSEGWRTTEGLSALAVLLFCAFSNLLLISYQESRDSKRPVWLEHALEWSILGILLFGNLCLYFFYAVGVGALFCGFFYLVIFIHLMTSTESFRTVRQMVDTILFLSAILILLLRPLPYP